jgi:ADP-ribose pyrophosphatase
MEKLGEICTAPGYCTEILHIYAARELQKGNHNREEGEYGMEIKEFTVDEVEKKIKSGEITDAKTICGLYLLKSKIDL